jgi:hypothetical protein
MLADVGPEVQQPAVALYPPTLTLTPVPGVPSVPLWPLVLCPIPAAMAPTLLVRSNTIASFFITLPHIGPDLISEREPNSYTHTKNLTLSLSSDCFRKKRPIYASSVLKCVSETDWYAQMNSILLLHQNSISQQF